MTPKKILQLGKFYPIHGGVERVMYDLTDGLSARGMSCDMACAILPKDRKGLGTSPILPLNGGKGRVICLEAWGTCLRTMVCPKMVSFLRKHREDYDLVHIHHPDPMAAVALWLSGYKGIVVLHYHSDILAQKKVLWLYKPLQDWLLRRARVIIGTTQAYIENSAYLRRMQSKCVSIPIGIRPVRPSAERAAQLRRQWPCGHLVFAAGRLVPYKGFEHLVDAALELPDDCLVVIAGTGPLEETLRKRIVEKGLSQKVRLAGFVDDETLAAWYGACDVSVLPSVMKTEAFGIVQLEAMSCGKPMVSTRIPGSGVSWVNQDGVSGLTVPPGDAHALAEAIRSICEEPTPRYREGAKKRFEDCFTLERMIEHVQQVYETL